MAALTEALRLDVVSVNVGKPSIIGTRHGAQVASGIAKSPVTVERLPLSLLNLDGDGQADLTVHGGPDKAVYAYPLDHAAYWQAAHGLALTPGLMGENLSVMGADEAAVAIGDVFEWGPARLAVSQPRQPCFKLAMRLGRDDIGAAMMVTARSGFYLRVLVPGDVPARAAVLRLVERVPEAPSVQAAFVALRDRDTPLETLASLANFAPLASDWRRAFAAKIEARLMRERQG